jgi:hypothetical protein
MPQFEAIDHTYAQASMGAIQSKEKSPLLCTISRLRHVEKLGYRTVSGRCVSYLGCRLATGKQQPAVPGPHGPQPPDCLFAPFPVYITLVNLLS